MLEYNPYFRPTAKQLLKNKIFDKIRDKNNEMKAPFKIVMNQNEDIDNFDYREMKFTNEKVKVINSIKERIIKEVWKVYLKNH